MSTGTKARVAAAAPAILVAVVFVGDAAFTWRRLGSLVIDGGRELEVPRRLLEGATLYRDVRWYWGPLAPWVNSALYAVAGVTSDTLMWAGIVTAAFACAGLYLIARRFVGPLTSAWVAIAFIVASAFAKRIPVAIFNFVAPFNFSATYGITLAIWSVLLLLRHAETGRTRPLAGSALLAGLVLLTKIETSVAVVAAHAAFFLSVLPRPSLRRVGVWSGGLAVAAAGYLVAAHASRGMVWHGLTELANPASRFYIRTTAGMSDPGASADDVARSVTGWAAVLAAAYVAARLTNAPTRGRLAAAVLAWGGILVVPAVLLVPQFFRCAPFVEALVLAWIVAIRVREGEGALDGRWREHLVVWTFALACFARIPLRAGPDHYGFYLIAPTLVCVAIGMTYLGGRTCTSSASRRALAVGASAVLAGFAAGAFRVSYPQLTAATMELRTARVHLRVDPNAPEAVFVPILSRLPSSTVCAAVPEGTGLVFAAGLTPPDDGMTSYLSMHVYDPAVERSVIEAWERKPPDVIFYFGVSLRDSFGYAGFGQDYAGDLGRWIAARYPLATDPVDGMRLLLRSDR